MDKKKILIIVGIVAVVGIGYYMYNKSKKTAEGGAEGGAEAPADATKSAEAPADATATAKAGQNIKDLKGKEKRDFRKGTKDVCREKYGKGKDYRECQKRVKGGGVAFDGSDFDQWENDYIDFSGLDLDL
jgi:hypothetical protein